MTSSPIIDLQPEADHSATGMAAPGSDSVSATPERPVRRLALSPSRAGDFKTCPLLYRFRTIDRLPEPQSSAQIRGTLVHAVLERMFAAPAEQRTPKRTQAAVRPLWDELSADRPDWQELVPEAELAAWLESAESLVRAYFDLENPTRFSPESCEMSVEIDISHPGGNVPLRGFIDRVDVAPTGQLRIVDYKTGRSPSETYEAGAMYQLKFYALMIYRMRGVVPAQLKLLYLADTRPLVYSPTEQELLAFERGVIALWSAITQAVRSGDFRARRSGLCGWCNHQAVCPEFGGTPPVYPGPPVEFADSPLPSESVTHSV